MKIKKMFHPCNVTINDKGESIRDHTPQYSIVGLSDKHLDCLTNILQACQLGAVMLSEMNQNEARQYFQNFNSTILSDEELKTAIDQEMEIAKKLNEILEAIKKPDDTRN